MILFLIEVYKCIHLFENVIKLWEKIYTTCIIEKIKHILWPRLNCYHSIIFLTKNCYFEDFISYILIELLRDIMHCKNTYNSLAIHLIKSINVTNNIKLFIKLYANYYFAWSTFLYPTNFWIYKQHHTGNTNIFTLFMGEPYIICV